MLLGAPHIDVCRQGGVRSTAILIAIGITEEGEWEILGFHPALGETGEAWKTFIGDLKKRGLSDVEHASQRRA